MPCAGSRCRQGRLALTDRWRYQRDAWVSGEGWTFTLGIAWFHMRGAAEQPARRPAAGRVLPPSTAAAAAAAAEEVLRGQTFRFQRSQHLLLLFEQAFQQVGQLGGFYM